MAYSSRSYRRGALFAGAAVMVGVLSACGGQTASGPQKDPGTAGPATEAPQGSDSAASSSASTPTDAASASAKGSDSAAASASAGGQTKADSAASGSRCHTSELSASVGTNNPGAGQENFPLVLTNKSSRTCTLTGYPGAAFVSASGSQLGADPKRTSGSPVTVTLRPGQSAWSGLTFSNPQVSGAKAAKPAALLITPPNEKDSLKVSWSGGDVPVSGNSSSSTLTVLNSGTG
ncbi:DUF4232 domain-containing protein, partial [Streptomyces sp. J2-1]|uniref:DUF4232 domain-containing protein n=1 Tax=Streptomyces corallincola TaxID=2851888 RepID=UPI001C37E8DE